MQTKTLKAPLAITSDEQGIVRAVFSVFNMVDSDNDVVLPSFFTDGQAVPMAAWGHDWNSLPPGKGVIRVQPEHALFDGQFFLDTTSGLEHFRTVKHLGPVQEWSFGFRVLEAEPGEFGGKAVRFLKRGEIYEASPVLVGANRSTYTQEIKAAAIDGGHDAKATWDAAYVNDLPDSAFAIILPGGEKDDEGKTTPRNLRKLPHHGADGKIDDAHLRNALSRLPRTSGLSDAQKERAQAHLDRHARAAGVGEAGHHEHAAKYGGVYGSEPPEGSYEALSEDIGEAFRATQLAAGVEAYVYVVATYPTHAIVSVCTMDGDEPTFWDAPYVVGADGETVTLGTPRQVEAETTFAPVKGATVGYDLHAARVESAVREFIGRTQAGSALRAKEGRPISEARRARMAAIRDGLRSHADELHAILEETAPREPAKAADVDISREYLAFLADEARRNGVAVGV